MSPGPGHWNVCLCFVAILSTCRGSRPVCKLCSASDVRRACAAQCDPAHVAAGMRAGAVRPSGSVWLATPGRGRSPLPGRRFVPASDVAHARTHWRAACKWGGAASSLPFCEPLQACLADVGIWTGGRRITVRRPLLPRVIRWGLHRLVSHSRKEGTVAVPAHASDAGWFP